MLSAASLLALPRALHAAPSESPRDDLKPLLHSLFSDLEAPRAVGRCYLASGPAAEAETWQFADRLAEAQLATASDLSCLLKRARHADADRGAFARVDGWLLPKAEAQTCALAVLL